MLHFCSKCGEPLPLEADVCARCGSELVPTGHGKPAKHRSAWVRVFTVMFFLTMTIAGLIFRTWLVIPFAATLGLTLSCLIYVFLWRPPAGATTREVMMVYMFFGIGTVITAVATLFSGCAMLFANEF